MTGRFKIPAKALQEAQQALPVQEGLPITGIYHGRNPTVTERDSGAQVEEDNRGPLKRDGAGHKALLAFASGDRLTAYDASKLSTGDFHAVRREATRLLVRGYLAKDGMLPNKAPRGRTQVDAYRLTDAGRVELERLSGRVKIRTREAPAIVNHNPGYTGFICGRCNAPIDSELRGDHKPGCPNGAHNERLYAEAELGKYGDKG